MEPDEQREIDDLLSRPTASRFGRRGRKSIYEAPEFTKRLSAFTEASAGNDVKFECQYKGFPRPTLRWYRDDELVQGDERYVFEESDGFAALSITKVGKNDEAAYKCKAENSEGVTSTTGYLSVTGDYTDKPLSCQGRQSDHAVSNPPPLRTIIEQKSMEEREEDAYPQLSTSPVDEILEEAALKGHGWPAMLGLKKKREKRKRNPNDEDYDSGSDTSVESQQDDRVDRETTPDADLVIDEGNLLPYDGPFHSPDGSVPSNDSQNVASQNMVAENGMTNGDGNQLVEMQNGETTPLAEQQLEAPNFQQQQQENPEFQQQPNPELQQSQELQQQSQDQSQNPNQINPMEVNPGDHASRMCQVPSDHNPQNPQDVQQFQDQLFSQQPGPPGYEDKNGFAEQSQILPPEYNQAVEDNVVPNMQTAPAMASPNEVQMTFEQPQDIQKQDVQAVMIQDPQMQQVSQVAPEAQPNLAQESQMMPEVQQPNLAQDSQMMPEAQLNLVQEAQMMPEVQPNLAQDSQMMAEAQPNLVQEAQMMVEVQPNLAQESQMQISTDSQETTQMQIEEVQNPEQVIQVQQGVMEVTPTEPVALVTEMNQQQQVNQQQFHAEGQPSGQQQMVQTVEFTQPTEMNQSSEMTQSSESSITAGNDSPVGASSKPDTEKQKSMESGYSTEDIDAAIQQEAAVTYTETMEIPVVKAALTEQQNQPSEQQATIIVGDGQTTPEVLLGAPVNLQVSFSGDQAQLPIGELPIGIQVQGTHPQVEAGNIIQQEDVDGLAQQAPPEVVAQPVMASPQIYQSPDNFVSLEQQSIQFGQPNQEPGQVEQQQPNQVQFVSSVSSEISEPQVLPQSQGTVMSPVQFNVAVPGLEGNAEVNPLNSQVSEVPIAELNTSNIEISGTQISDTQVSQSAVEDDTLYNSASNPFRTSTEGTHDGNVQTTENEEMLASYTRTFSSTIEEEDNGQEVGGEVLPVDPTSDGTPIVTHSNEIVTLATVETSKPFHDWLPFPWLPMSLLVTVSSFLAVAFEVNPSLFVLLLFVISLIGFRFVTKRVEPKED